MEMTKEQAIEVLTGQYKMQEEAITEIRQQISYLAGIRNDMTEKIDSMSHKQLEMDKQRTDTLRQIHKLKTGEDV